MGSNTLGSFSRVTQPAGSRSSKPKQFSGHHAAPLFKILCLLANFKGKQY